MSTAPTDLLNRLCRRGARLHVEPEGWDHSIPHRFWRVQGATLGLKIEGELDAEGQVPLHAGQEIWALFENVGRIRSFRTKIVEIVADEDGKPVGLRCEVPPEIVSTDRRRAFRVPRILPATLQATLRSGDRQWQTVVCNLSVVGGLLEFDEGVGPRLDDGAAYTLHLTAPESSTKIGARIVRVTQSERVAVRFPSSMRLGEVTPPPDLAKVVRLCEILWLRRRNRRDEAAA